MQPDNVAESSRFVRKKTISKIYTRTAVYTWAILVGAYAAHPSKSANGNPI